MKKTILPTLVLLAFVLFQSNYTNAGDRKVLLERFTSSTCGPCAQANPTFEAFINSSDPNKIVTISYHMNWPSPGNDPMYWANVADNNTRRSQYGVNAIPDWLFDGVIQMYGGSSVQLQNAFNSRTNILSPVNIIMTETRNGSTVNAKVDIYCEGYISTPIATVQFGVIENMVYYNGANGEHSFSGVMRKMLPTALGTSVLLLPGKKITLNYSYEIDPSWNSNLISKLVFVQGTPLEIINAGTLTNDFNLYSLPAYKTVIQGQSQNADYKIYIPSVASGYNSPVTFSYEVIPPTPGITATFSNGNVISNFPDSLSVNVSSTPGVATGEYQVVLTGTSASGKVHKTIVNYLVGKNYCVIGPNRSQISYKVDNVSYNTSKVFTWDLNSNHTLEALSPQTFGNTRYVFENWSNGGTQSQTITVGTQESNFTANYKTQFRMIGIVDPSGLPVTISGAGVYHDSGLVNNISLSATQVQFNGHTYYFNRWEGTGNGSYTGNNPSPQISINAAIVQKAVFDTINVGISNYNTTIPDRFELYQNYPNPFNPTTNIKFDIAKSTFTSIVIYDMLGKEVSKLVNQDLTPGRYQYNFDASNFPSGIYYYRIKTDSYTEIKKMILLK